MALPNLGIFPLAVRCSHVTKQLSQRNVFRLNHRHLHSLASEVEVLDVKDKIIYNSFMPKHSFIKSKIIEQKIKKEAVGGEIYNSIALKLLMNEKEEILDAPNEIAHEELEIKLPYTTNTVKLENYISKNESQENLENVSYFNDNKQYLYETICDENTKSVTNWMENYEKYTDEYDEESLNSEWKFEYGSADPTIPVSNTPCGGCGAILHCQNLSIPGFLPTEIFVKCREKDLRSLKCQRCHFLENYNTALSVTVDPHFYPKLLSSIKDKKALVILLTDMTDFPSSIWPGILDVIGRKRPIFLVGNKVDLLWGDGKGWLDRVKETLRTGLPSWANVRHVCLISARTGFGVEELINKLHNIWQYKGDVYLVGCTNVGKSTLFNALLQSDYCKVKAVDLVQRATTAPWPGTTLNLLKFPILRPEGWRLYLRTQRLICENKEARIEAKLRKEQRRLMKIKHFQPQLIGHVGRTFKGNALEDVSDEKDSFSVPNRKEVRGLGSPGSGLDPNDPELTNSRWVYDTPGVLHKEQILDLLTTEEVVLTLPTKVIEPRTFLIKQGWSIFIGGIARLDYTKGEPVKITVFASSGLPITICETSSSEDLYSSLLRTNCLSVPQPIEARLEKWPGLEHGPEITLCGVHKEVSCADILLSSAGWIAITPGAKEICKFLPWTPEHRGITSRIPSLLPQAVSLRGKKIPKTPVYLKSRSYC